MNTLLLPLVNWGMGNIIIGVFALVCIVIIAVIYSLTRGNNSISDQQNQRPEEM